MATLSLATQSSVPLPSSPPVLSQTPPNRGFPVWERTSCPDVLRSLPRVALQVADQCADRQSPQWVRVPFAG